MSHPTRVRIVEVGPRDGLQNEPSVIERPTKLAFIEALAAAGLPEIEVGAFVRPDAVPQMADSAEVCAALEHGAGSPRFVALVPNSKGLERALAAGVRRVAVFTAASQAFAERNIGMSVDDSLARFREVAKRALAEGVSVRGYVSTAWWCPFAGPVDAAATIDVTQRLLDIGCDEVSVADTIGAATPGEVGVLLDKLCARVDPSKLAVHFHDTRGTALANVLVALSSGVATVDASAGGLGGCPFAPGATGNLATEDLLYMLDGMGIETGVDLDALCAASRLIAEALGRPLPSRYLRAGAPPSGGAR